ncbi:ligase-associated DNA damage response exonuclease [uncultured Methylovirgula sp.]|uniref:ligase-associated DNA damage response exonuclease n=1 Tax=uncultured Methylovirgula sp. TaxID=1285960 RepID=UPI0026106553|nr:ligase-associated DNA damage response exonuclease [uncultured Methylovirgula sp.]
MQAGLLTLKPAGLYCAAGDFFIDPLRPVGRAIITHAHADHARAGHAQVLATAETLALMAVRYGENFAGATQSVAYGETLGVGGVAVSFHPAGHVLGSAQIQLERGGARTVISGDYKREADPTCARFTPLVCDTFISEATFGLPVFRHAKTAAEIDKLLASQRLFPERTHLVGVYALGKAQRVIALLRAAGYDRPVYIHGALEKITAYYQEAGIALGDVRRATGAGDLPGEIVLCPPTALNDLWSRKFAEPLTAFASGWMRVRAHARQRGIELPLVISDHADWDGLCATIQETNCETLLVTHGEPDALVHCFRQRGLNAEPLHILGYGDEEADAPPETGA